MRRGAQGHEGAMAVLCAGFAQVVVKEAVVVAAAKPDQVSFELFKPAVDEELWIGLDRFNLANFLCRDNNSADNCSVARYSVTLEGPTIAQELGAQVPLLCPIIFQALSSLLISDDGKIVPFPKHIKSTSVDKGITGRVEGKSGEIEGDCEREFKAWDAVSEIRLAWISSRRICCNI